MVWTWDVHECVTLATILQKSVFDHIFWTKALRNAILVFRSMFLRSRNPMVPFILTHDLAWHLQNNFWAISQLLIGKTLPKFNARQLVPASDENEDEDQQHLMTNFIQGEIAAHELYKVRDMNHHKSQLSISTQVNQWSIRQISTIT